MPAFHYIALDQAGREQKGVMEAENEKHARVLMRAKALLPVKLEQTQEKKLTTKPTGFSLFSLRKKPSLTAKELALITRQLATLLAAGLPVESALLAVSEQADKGMVKGILLSVRAKVTEGHTLANALSDHPKAFSALYCATVAAGEKSGHLDTVLLRLADYTEEQWKLSQKLKTALIYPAMIILVAIGIVGFLLEYVVPKMVTVYGHLNQSLPIITEILIAVSNGVKNEGLIVLLLLFAGLVAFRTWLKKSVDARLRWHHLLLRLPFIGFLLKTADTARFARTLSILSASGVSVLEAMTIASQLVKSLPIKAAIDQAIRKVREGAAIYLALKATHFFSPMSVHMVASGEASGQLEPMLERVARMQEEEVNRLIEVSLALFEPAVIFMMGAVVLFIVLAVLLPIFQLNDFTG